MQEKTSEKKELDDLKFCKWPKERVKERWREKRTLTTRRERKRIDWRESERKEERSREEEEWPVMKRSAGGQLITRMNLQSFRAKVPENRKNRVFEVIFPWGISLLRIPNKMQVGFSLIYSLQRVLKDLRLTKWYHFFINKYKSRSH